MSTQNGTAELGNARNLDFYTVTAATTIPENARQLLIKYAGLSPEEVDSHVDAIREKAFKIFPYPCIGMYRFLDLSLTKTEVYSEVLERVKNGEHFLDLGCCFGQEIRQLIADGAPAENLHGSDLRQEFVDLGYDLFKDKGGEGRKISWHVADVFDDNAPEWSSIQGKISIVYTGSFFHLFDREQQIAVAKRIVSLLKNEPDVLVIGRQVGNINPGLFSRSGYEGERHRFRHNEQSWTELWDEVGAATGTKWDVKAELDLLGIGLGEVEGKLSELRLERGARRLRFVVRRL